MNSRPAPERATRHVVRDSGMAAQQQEMTS
jgi:hypothetical protein